MRSQASKPRPRFRSGVTHLLLRGSKTVAILRRRGHEVAAASPNTGVDTITGEGLEEALAGAPVAKNAKIPFGNCGSIEGEAR